jgi:hypothetical protein
LDFDYELGTDFVGTPPPAISVLASAPEFLSLGVAWKVISNSYPVDPVITLVDGMLGVYVPPYARSTVNTPKLEIQLVVQVGGLKG